MKYFVKLFLNLVFFVIMSLTHCKACEEETDDLKLTRDLLHFFDPNTGQFLVEDYLFNDNTNEVPSQIKQTEKIIPLKKTIKKKRKVKEVNKRSSTKKQTADIVSVEKNRQTKAVNSVPLKEVSGYINITSVKMSKSKTPIEASPNILKAYEEIKKMIETQTLVIYDPPRTPLLPSPFPPGHLWYSPIYDLKGIPNDLLDAYSLYLNYSHGPKEEFLKIMADLNIL